MAPQSKTTTIDNLSVNAIRFLSIDAVQKANSGHPGAPMGAAPMAYTLWDRYLKHNPTDPNWFNRDRFVLSAGHASMLLYSLLHLTGYDLSIDDIKDFRQWGSKTPGHPEYGLTPGAEMTTGPLGQGFAHGIGMAIAEKILAEHYNRPDCRVIDHYTYGIVSDGDLMEGVASEAASLAGTLGLGKLIYLYDDNDISIEGNTDITFTEDVSKRFQSYNWHVVGPINGMNIEEVDNAISQARKEDSRPSLIIATTTIGYGSPNKANTGGVHGAPLGEEEVALTRQNLDWEHLPFVVPDEVSAHMLEAVARGQNATSEWNELLVRYEALYPSEAGSLRLDIEGNVEEACFEKLDQLFNEEEKPLATREAGGRIMNHISQKLHSLVGGSADLAPSTNTLLSKHVEIGAAIEPHNMHFGVREHAMGSIAGGMALHGGMIPYTATFLIFSDYMRPPMRLAALMGQRVIYVFTHDSIALGEDGPTHQPVEQLIGLRAIPNMTVLRPADATETSYAWKAALLNRTGPTSIVLTRQGVPIIDRHKMPSAEAVLKGAYTLWEKSANPDVILIATGSEVQLALTAAMTVSEQGFSARVVSMPSWELFEQQGKDYQESVLPTSVTARISIEAACTLGWSKYIGPNGYSIGVDTFGASAPFKTLYEKYGLTVENIIQKIEHLLGRK
ncbi:MAG: transketolase [Dehalococcoidia bacterium]|nr:transketolase [Dehalococcoidia bacterium]